MRDMKAFAGGEGMTVHRWKLAALVAAVSLSAPARAGLDYAAYEGRDAIHEGQGGTKVTKNGIDYWTTGAPPRRFQVLGRFTDTRGDGPISGKAIGSKEIAKRTLEAGGNAVILIGRTEAFGGMVHFENVYAQPGSAQANGQTMVKTDVTSTMLVVKYLAD